MLKPVDSPSCKGVPATTSWVLRQPVHFNGEMLEIPLDKAAEILMNVLAIWTRHFHWWMQRSFCSHSVVSCHFDAGPGASFQKRVFTVHHFKYISRKTETWLNSNFHDTSTTNATRNLSAIGKNEKSSTAFQQLIHRCKRSLISFDDVCIVDICFMFALMQCNLDMSSPLAPPTFFIDLAKCNTLISVDGFHSSGVSQNNISPSFPQITYVVSMFETCCMVSSFRKQRSHCHSVQPQQHSTNTRTSHLQLVHRVSKSFEGACHVWNPFKPTYLPLSGHSYYEKLNLDIFGPMVELLLLCEIQ